MLQHKLVLQGGAALLVAVVLIGLRAATLGVSDDPALERAVRDELANRLGARTLTELKGFDAQKDDSGALAARARPQDIEVHRCVVSRPLLYMTSDEEVVVYAEYTLPGDPPQADYLRFQHYLGGQWRYLRSANVVSFYCNVL